MHMLGFSTVSLLVYCTFFAIHFTGGKKLMTEYQL